VAGAAVGRSGPGIAYNEHTAQRAPPHTPSPGGVIRSNAIVIFDIELVNMKG